MSIHDAADAYVRNTNYYGAYRDRDDSARALRFHKALTALVAEGFDVDEAREALEGACRRAGGVLLQETIRTTSIPPTLSSSSHWMIPREHIDPPEAE